MPITSTSICPTSADGSAWGHAHREEAMDSTTEKHWYLVQCKPKQDLRALENLQRQGYECLQAIHIIERLQKGKWRSQEEPLFPGYIFIRLDFTRDNWIPIHSTRGVNQIVSFGAGPLSIPEKIISRIQERVNSRQIPVFGEKVNILCAGEIGLEAIFLEKDGTERAILLLNILKREIRISTHLTAIEIQN